MATGFYSHQVRSCTRISFPVVLILSLELLSQNVHSYPVDLTSESDSSEASGDFYWTYFIVPVVFLISIVFFTVLCTGGCCQWFGRRRVVEVPMGFSNPVADAAMTMPISQIDVRALELDPIVFEPLPTLHDLTPVSSNANRFHGDRSRDSFDPRTQLSPIVPFSADDANVYAHDWFDEPHRNFPRGNIEYVKEVGKGWFGQVIEAEARDIVPFARKIRVLVKVLRDDATGVEQMRFLDESRWYRDSNHGNILKLLGHSIETIPFLLIMEHCPQGDLKSFLIANVTRAEMLNSDGAIVRMALDIAKGLMWMTSSEFVHADLATRNCQVGSEGRVLIGDYGLSTQAFRDDYYWSSNIAIPLRWTAPETLHCTINTIQTLKVTKMSNVWTFGVVLWEICEFGKLPYFELSDDEVISRVIIDKNYTLGQPTMSCLAAKEQLYQVMQSCWNPVPERRPRISSIVEELEAIYKTVHTTVMSPGDEFDSKWEQLSRTPASGERDKGRKKNVSFLGFQEDVVTDDSQISISGNTFSLTNVTKVSTNESSSPKDSSKSVSMEMESMSMCTTSTDPDEEHWRKRIERGDISEKVREKSQSVQDLMVLTHVEASELSDPESLIMISKSSSSFQQTAMGLPPSAGLGTVHNSTLFSNSSNSVIRKSSSDTALSSIVCPSTANSSQNQSAAVFSEGSGAALPNSNPSKLFSSLSMNVNNSNSFVNGTSVTPENAAVKIKVIDPTPIAEEKGPANPQEIITVNGNHHPGQNDIGNSKNTPVSTIPSKLKFVVRSEEKKSSQRHTSTPLRTPSPQVELNGELENSANDVFYSLSPANKSNNSTWNISPISKARNSSLETDGFSSLVMGPSDDLGLKPYQKVTTELNESSIGPYSIKDSYTYESVSNSKGDSSDFAKVGTEPPKVNFKVGALYGDTKILSPRNSSSKTPVPRVLFPSEDSPNLGLQDDSHYPSIQKSSNDYPSSHSNGVAHDITSSSAEMADESASINTANASSRVNTFYSFKMPEDIEGFKETVSESAPTAEDEDDFWEKQMQSFQEAAGNTRALFQLGLGQDSENDLVSKDKFVEDIEAAAEELGSLVMTDLEEENHAEEVVKETRDEVEVGRSIRSKIAFDEQSDLVDDYPAEWEQDLTTENTEVTVLEQSNGNSVFLAKKLRTKESSESDSTVNSSKDNGRNSKDYDCEESEIEDDNDVEDICTDFVPSKWNQNLAPTKPAIKSPEQQPPTVHKSNLRKSVSFERKKPQLVYEYPPPPPASDSDDDDKVLLGASLPMALSSSLDWELTQEELEESEINHEDWGEDDVITKAENPMDVYRISGFGDDQFHIRGSSEPFVFSPSTLGELRHTRDRLKLDLSKGEASILDEESKGAKLDSGVGSSTNVSPFNNCDNHT